MDTVAFEPCPRCGAPCPKHPGYPVWCDACGWNVEPLRPKPPSSLAEATRARAGSWMAASVLGEVSGGRRSIGLYRVATYLYALAAYAILAACFFGGIALIVLTWANVFLIVVGIVLVGIAWVAHPWPPKAPELADRSEFAAVYALADQVAEALGAHRVDGVAVNADFNASFGRYGWRGRRIMTLGLPLLTALEPQERVALVAHGIAHDVSRDPARGLFVWNAFMVLVELYDFFRPQQVGIGATYARQSVGGATVSLGGRLANIVLAGLAFLVRPFLHLFAILMLRDSQRAEYLADALAADVAGDVAARTMLRKLHLGITFANLAKGAAAQGEHVDILGALRRWVADAPDSEWQRVEKIMQLQQTQLYSTHPPTSQRTAFLGSRSPAPPRVTMTAEERDAIDRELMPLERAFTASYLDQARARLYRR